jgi:nucleotide-binding universal stress UspA family protein
MSPPRRPGPGGEAAGTGIRRVLAATDFSDGAKAAAERAHGLSILHDARLTLLHVMPEGGGNDMRRVAERGLDQIAAELSASVTETEVVSGSVGTAISEAAERLGADLIVIGAHGANWLKDMFVGSTAETVADSSSVPVLLVKHLGSEPYDVILLAVDLSERAEETASRTMALTPGARHLLVHIAAIIGENLLRVSGASHEDIEELRRAQAQEAVPHVWAIAKAVGPVRAIVEPGRPEQRVPQLARELHADLIAVGTKRLTGLRHTLLGSVARHTIRHAQCDVLIVRTP